MLNLEARRMRLRRKKAIREGLTNALLGMVGVLMLVGFMKCGLDAWEREREIIGENNRQWIEQMNEAKMNK